MMCVFDCVNVSGWRAGVVSEHKYAVLLQRGVGVLFGLDLLCGGSYCASVMLGKCVMYNEYERCWREVMCEIIRKI